MLGDTSDGSEPASTSTAPAPDFTIATAEKEHIEGVLLHFGGNRQAAAAALGIARSTLLAKIRRYKLE